MRTRSLDLLEAIRENRVAIGFGGRHDTGKGQRVMDRLFAHPIITVATAMRLDVSPTGKLTNRFFSPSEDGLSNGRAAFLEPVSLAKIRGRHCSSVMVRGCLDAAEIDQIGDAVE